MSNVNYRSQFHYSYAGQPVSLYAKITFGAAGAPTLVSGTGMGIASVVRISAGLFRINLTQQYASTLAVNAIMKTSSPSPAAPVIAINSDHVADSNQYIQLITSTGGTATDPASGEEMYLDLKLNRSSLNT